LSLHKQHHLCHGKDHEACIIKLDTLAADFDLKKHFASHRIKLDSPRVKIQQKAVEKSKEEEKKANIGVAMGITHMESTDVAKDNDVIQQSPEELEGGRSISPTYESKSRIICKRGQKRSRSGESKYQATAHKDASSQTLRHHSRSRSLSIDSGRSPSRREGTKRSRSPSRKRARLEIGTQEQQRKERLEKTRKILSQKKDIFRKIVGKTVENMLKKKRDKDGLNTSTIERIWNIHLQERQILFDQAEAFVKGDGVGFEKTMKKLERLAQVYLPRKKSKKGKKKKYHGREESNCDKTSCWICRSYNSTQPCAKCRKAGEIGGLEKVCLRAVQTKFHRPSWEANWTNYFEYINIATT